MARTAPAPPTKAVRTWGRGAASQEEVEGWTARDQGASEAAMIGPRERGEGEEQQQEEEDDEDEDKEESLRSSGEQESKNEQPLEPPSKS